MRRLALGLPTGLQIHTGAAFLFHKDGVSAFRNLDGEIDYGLFARTKDDRKRIWVLVDSSPNFSKPAPIFRYASSFFIIDTMSPGSPHIDRSWLNKQAPQYFYMEPWSVSELLQARTLFSVNPLPTEDQILHLRNHWGASTRSIVLHANNPVTYERIVKKAIDGLGPRELPSLFQINPRNTTVSSCIIASRPSKTNRGRPDRTIVSQHVLDLLWERHTLSCLDITTQAYNSGPEWEPRQASAPTLGVWLRKHLLC